tara:strand:- start:96 stop:308 length:213 start_codon:yes stop_codon:yes gene_type:complete
MISEQDLTNKIKILDGDIEKVVQNISTLDKQKVDNIATLHALQGARQQCQSFLNELRNDGQPTKKASRKK